MKNDTILMDLKSYKESLLGGLHDAEEITEIITEMQNAKIGAIKPNCWKKISDDTFGIYIL